MSDILIERLGEQIAVLSEIRRKLQQEKLEASTEIKVGDIISWTIGGQLIRRGLVLKVQSFIDTPVFVVRGIRKDGKIGGSVKVYYWNNPKKESQ